MNIELAIIAASTAVLLVYFGVWYTTAARRSFHDIASSRGYRVSSALLVLLLVNRMFVLPGREDVSALISEGLSATNILTVALTLVGTVWAGHLLVASRLSFRRILSGSGVWFSAFLATNAISIIWSSWSALTGFRVIELFAVAVLVGHVVAYPNTEYWLERLMWLALATQAISLLVGGAVAPADLVGFAALRSNTGGVVAGILILYYVTQALARRSLMSWWKLAGATYAFVLFGSVASLIAVLTALLVGLVLHMCPRVGVVIAGAALMLIVGLASYFVVVPPDTSGTSLFDYSLVREYAATLGKQPHHFGDLTGRVPVWTSASEAVERQPWGFGFAAGERLLPLTAGYDAPWAARHAHNGFVSGYLSAGLIGLAMVGLVFIAASRSSAAPRGFAIPVLIFMAVNNVAAAVLGSAFHPAWVALALIVYWTPDGRSMGNTVEDEDGLLMAAERRS